MPLFVGKPDNAALVAVAGLGLAEVNAEAMRAAIEAAPAEPSLRTRAAATTAELAGLPKVAAEEAAMPERCDPA